MFLLIGLLFSVITSIAVASAENKDFQYFDEYGKQSRRIVDYLVSIDGNYRNICNKNSENADRVECDNIVMYFDKLSAKNDFSKSDINLSTLLSLNKTAEELGLFRQQYPDPVERRKNFEIRKTAHTDRIFNAVNGYKAEQNQAK